MTGCKLANAGERLPRRRKGDAELGRHNWYMVSPPSLAGQFVNTKENNMSNEVVDYIKERKGGAK